MQRIKCSVPFLHQHQSIKKSKKWLFLSCYVTYHLQPSQSPPHYQRVGSYLDMMYRWERGDYLRSFGNGALFITDVALVKALFGGFIKATMKAGLKDGTKRYFGIGMSHEYGATVSRLSRLGVDMSGSKHHWLISQSMMKQYPLLKPIGNQAWNLTGFSSQANHMRWAHGTAYPSLRMAAIPFSSLLYPVTSTPIGLKLGASLGIIDAINH